MNRPHSGNGEEFIRDYLDEEDAVPTPSSESPTSDERFEERRRWATTAVAAFGVAAIAGACYAIAGSYWDVWPLGGKATFLVALIALSHVGGVVAERRSEPLLAHFLYCLATATFVGGAIALFVGADFARAQAGLTNAIPPTALLAFAAAQTSSSRSLHFLATAALVLGFVYDDGSQCFFVFSFSDCALVCAALGEYWAWRRPSQSVATIYLGVFLWALGQVFLCPPFPIGARALLLLCAVGLYIRWFGAAFRSAFGATFGIFVALCSIGLTAFPYFWTITFSTSKPPFGLDVATAATCESVLAAALFVVFATRLIFDGARQNVVQFALAIAFFAIWLIAQSFVVGAQFKENRWAIAPPATAAIAFAIMLVKSRLKRYGDFIITSPPPAQKGLSTDALDDEQELDDVFDSEARAGAQTPRLSPISDSLDEFWDDSAKTLRFPTYVATVLAQMLAIFDFANDGWKIF